VSPTAAVCQTVLCNTAAGGWECGLDLPAAAEKCESGFLMDIKGSKFQKFDKCLPTVSFQVQAGDLSCFHSPLKCLEEQQYSVN